MRCLFDAAQHARQTLYGEDKPRALPTTYATHPMTTGYTRTDRDFYAAGLSTHQSMMRFALTRCFGRAQSVTRHAMLTELVVQIPA
jgi:hypothetical protein